MNPPPLTPAQFVKLSVLIGRNQLQTVPIDLVKAQLFLDQATEALVEILKMNTNKVRYDTAYNVAHDVGEALLAAYGYRTTSGTGQHAAIGEFLEIILVGNPAQSASTDFDALREGRNALRYQAKPIGKAQADFASMTAQTLLNGAKIIFI